MGAFSYVIAEILCLSYGLTMGSDFSPAIWKVCRCLAEKLATSLFGDNSLIAKHRQYLDQLQWSKKLGKIKSNKIVPAQACSKYNGVLNKQGKPEITPHHLFVNDDVYAKVYNVKQVERYAAVGIKSSFILLGESAVNVHQIWYHGTSSMR